MRSTSILIATLALALAGPLGAQTADPETGGAATGGDASAGTAGDDAAATAGDAAATGAADAAGISDDAISADEDDDVDVSPGGGGNQTARPEPARQRGTGDLVDPDPGRIAAGRQPNPALLADRRAPDAYPRLDRRDDEAQPVGLPDDVDGAATEEEQARALMSALAGMGCAIPERALEARLAPLGFTYDTVNSVLTGLFLSGGAATDAGGNIQIDASVCPPDEAAPTPRDRVLSAFRENGCALDEAALQGLGYDEGQILAILGPMRDSGAVVTEGDTARLSQALCDEG